MEQSRLAAQRAWAILLAAGSGTRLGKALPVPKQFLQWRARPLYWHCARAFARCACIEGVVFVFPEAYLPDAELAVGRLDSMENLGIPWRVVAGGRRRQDSAAAGCAAVPLTAAKILIHDAARPFVTPELIWRVFAGVERDWPCAIPAVPLKDTVKVVGESGAVARTLARESLVAVQTPQGFAADVLRQAQGSAPEVTDDASLLELLGYRIRIVPGEEANIKITTPYDLERLNQGAERRPCSGFGYDVHKYGPGRPLVIGGIPIPGGHEVLAHSDGDVLLHALADAILGCAGLGDIGELFPDSDPAYAGISSAVLLDEVLTRARQAGVELCQADLTVVAQKPKLAPWRQEIRKNVARLLGLESAQVNFKATTEEGLGFTGRQEGIKAYALVNGLRCSGGSC